MPTKAEYRKINHDVMVDTVNQYENNPKLIEAIKVSIDKQFMVAQEDNIDQPVADVSNTHYVVSGKRSFEAARGYKGKKVAVLNYANNHCVGGAPFSAGAQEESLCRSSTLYPCISAMRGEFYRKHSAAFDAGELDYMGNDDLIYTPDVVVFKTDERTDPFIPQMMKEDEWYNVDVITCAAPELWHGHKKPADYESRIRSRIKKILDVAALQKAEVLILGGWGCGAFKNDPVIVANVFYELLKNYNFETVEFAMSKPVVDENSPFVHGACEICND